MEEMYESLHTNDRNKRLARDIKCSMGSIPIICPQGQERTLCVAGNMLTLPYWHRDGEMARERLHHLLLDSLKKDRETDTKSGLGAAARTRIFTADDSGEAANTSTRRLIAAPQETIQVVIVECETELVGQS